MHLNMPHTDTATAPIRRPRVYISGPITGYPQANEPAFRAAAAALQAAGMEPVVPHDNGLPPTAEWGEHMRADLQLMLRCDAVARLDGWVKSKGARVEIFLAAELGIPCAHLDDHLTAFGALQQDWKASK